MLTAVCGLAHNRAMNDTERLARRYKNPRHLVADLGAGSVDAAAEALGYSRSTLYNWLQAGMVPLSVRHHAAAVRQICKLRDATDPGGPLPAEAPPA
jgi:transposase-like protein